MARHAREVADNGIYHIFNKVNEEKFLFEDDTVKDMFLKVLNEAKFKKKYGFVIGSLTIMSNHIHMLIQTEPGQNLGKIMQWIFGVFAIRYNRRFHRKGHFWIDRFKSVLIKTAEALEKTVKYIWNNPVKAGLVKLAEDYAYGFFRLVKDKIHGALFGKIQI